MILQYQRFTCAEKQKKHMTVALSGDGADELFAGVFVVPTVGG